MLKAGVRVNAPETKYEYCDNIYSVLHLVQAAVLKRMGDGRTVQEYIEERVLRRVGADETFWFGDPRMPSMADSMATGKLARGYNVLAGGEELICKPYSVFDNFTQLRDWTYGASGYAGTATSLAKCMQAFGGDQNRSGSKVLQKETIDAAFKVSPPSACGLNIIPYGQTRQGAVYGHGGSNGAVAVILPGGEAVACVVTGTLGLNGWDTRDHSKLGKPEDVLGFWSRMWLPICNAFP